MGQLYEFEQGLRQEAEARCNDTNVLDMRNMVSMTPEGISKPSLDVRATSWSAATGTAGQQTEDDISAARRHNSKTLWKRERGGKCETL